MPTGYTARIADGITFNEFVMGCARGMGALIMMRDEPSGAAIPERFEPSDYHLKKGAEAESKLERLSFLKVEEAEVFAKEDYDKECAYHADSIRKNNDLRSKYEAMLEKVEAWNPPTKDHEGMKSFMIEQITKSIDFDCDNRHYTDNPPKLLDATTWVDTKASVARRDIKYHHNEYSKEVARTERRNIWLKELRESLK